MPPRYRDAAGLAMRTESFGFANQALKPPPARSFCASLTHRNPNSRWYAAMSGVVAILARLAHSTAWRWQYLAYDDMTTFPADQLR
jgi:hypothetical protein